MPDPLDIRMLLLPIERKYSDDNIDIVAHLVYVIREDGQEKIRNFSDSFGSEHAEWSALQFPAYYTPSKDEIWGWCRIQYRDVFSVELAQAERMVKELRRLHRAYEASVKRLGPPESYPAFVARMGSILGVSQYGFKASGDDTFYDGNEYRWTDASNIKGYLDYALKPYRKETTHA